jgi:signal transduction histidine kinase
MKDKQKKLSQLLTQTIKHKWIFLLVPIFLLPIIVFILNPSRDSVISGDGREIINLDNSNLLVLHDHEAKLEIQDILKLDDSVFNLDGDDIQGFTSGRYWIKFFLPSFQNDFTYLFERYGVDEADFYIPNNLGQYSKIESGWSLSLSTRARPLRHTNFYLNSSLESSELPYYLSLQSATSMRANLQVMTEKGLSKFMEQDLWSYGLYFGLAAGLLFYAILFSLVFRNKEHYMFTLYFLFSMISIAYNTGLPSVYLWPSAPVFNRIVGTAFAQFNIGFLLHFIDAMIGGKQQNPKLSKGIHILSYIFFSLSLVFLIIPASIAFNISSYFIMLVPIFLLATCIYLSIQKHDLTLYYWASFLFFGIGIAAILLRNLGTLGQSPHVTNVFEFSYLLHMLMLAVGLAYKVQKLRTSEQKTKIELKDLNLQLEDRIQKRTEELEQHIENLNLAQTQLIESEKHSALGRMVSGVAHEINTPVGNCITAASYLETLVSELMNQYPDFDLEQLKTQLPKLKEISEILQINLFNAAEIVGAFKQISVDQDFEETRQFSLHQYFNEIVISFKNKLKPRKITIENHIPQDLSILSIPGSFGQIFSNFISNSLLHGFERNEKGIIRISQINAEENLIICYEDTGAGIPEELLPQIFDPFMTTKRNKGGTGLGLSVTFNLVTQKLGGSISCESSIGLGTKFFIKLPKSIIVT